MDRRKFLLNSCGLAAGAVLGSGLAKGIEPEKQAKQKQGGKGRKPSRFSHKLPESDKDYMRHRTYIEEVPVAEYSWASDEAYEAFLDMKYGVRIHWGIYSIWHLEGESWPFLGNRKPDINFEKRQEYQQLYKTWNPTGFNAEEWMKLFSESGMKMFAFTTKHHEGFSMFDTRTRVKKRTNWAAPGGPKMEDCDLAYSIMETPFKRDVVKELCQAADKYGIKKDLYFSHSDWYDCNFRPYGYHPLQIPSSAEWCKAQSADEPETELERTKGRQKSYFTVVPDPTPAEEAQMIQRHRAQLKELLTNYGKIDMMCLDIWLGPRVWPQLRQTLIELRKIQPDVMFRARGIGNYGDYYTPEKFVPESKENSDVPWFVIYPLGSSFSYDPDPKSHKGAKWIVQNIIDSAAKGGNFMVGIGPDEKGQFAPEAIRQVRQVGSWLKSNGKGIYATRSRQGEWNEGDNVRFTRSKDNKTIYAHCFEWPGEELVLKTVTPRKGSKISLLGIENSDLKWETSAKGLVISTPASLRMRIPEDEQVAFSFSINV
jgi:alpha-L-fucosidase